MDIVSHISRKGLCAGVFLIVMLFGMQEAHAAILVAPATVTTCGNQLSTPGTYTLGNSISTTTSLTCLTVSTSSVIIDGANFSINGKIVGDGTNPGDQGWDFTVQNVSVNGTISSNGADDDGSCM